MEKEKTNTYIPLPEPIPITEQEWPKGTLPLVHTRTMTYMHENFIRECIESILMQKTTFPVQVLIHDDASTDKTAEIVKEYELKYPKLIKAYYQNENTFSKKDKNEKNKLKETFNNWRTGKYEALCEGDDYWTDPFKLQKQVDFLEANPDFVICFHNAVVKFEDDASIDSIYSDFEWNNITRNKDVYTMEDVIAAPLIPTASLVYKKPSDFYVPKSFFNVASGDMVLAMLLVGDKKIKYFDEFWSVYRRHKGGITTTHRGNWIHANRIYMYLRMMEHYNYKYKEAFTKVISQHINKMNDFKLISRVDKLQILKLIPIKFLRRIIKTVKIKL